MTQQTWPLSRLPKYMPGVDAFGLPPGQAPWIPPGYQYPTSTQIDAILRLSVVTQTPVSIAAAAASVYGVASVGGWPTHDYTLIFSPASPTTNLACYGAGVNLGQSLTGTYTIPLAPVPGEVQWLAVAGTGANIWATPN
jgi:hypothetical protein